MKPTTEELIMGGITIIIIIMTTITMFDYVNNSFIKENHCLKEESYYYRIEKGLFTSVIKTTEENSDGIDWKCIEWEEEISVGSAILGQKLIYEKGSLKEENKPQRRKRDEQQREA